MQPLRLIILIVAATMIFACSNDPYPESISNQKVLYSAFRDAPRTLDPVQAYTTNATAINGNIYESLLEYHYLERPYQLIPALASAVPKPQPLESGRIAYEFELRPDLLFQGDVCFLIHGNERDTPQFPPSRLRGTDEPFHQNPGHGPVRGELGEGVRQRGEGCLCARQLHGTSEGDRLDGSNASRRGGGRRTDRRGD